MKIKICLFFFVFTIGAQAQELPIDFENIESSVFINFDGGFGTVIPNPEIDDANPSDNVGQIIRQAGAIWAGSKIDLSENLEFDVLNSISMKVYTSAPVGTLVKFKLEGNGAIERDAYVQVSNEWHTLTWDFTAQASNYNSLVFMFDFGNVGDGTTNSTFLFDDIEQFDAGLQIDLPVDFESNEINYSVTDFGGNVSTLLDDPSDANNTVMQVVKTNQAATWAGTTIGTPAGFANYIPLSLSDSKMTVRVWSQYEGIPVRLKVEDANDPTHTCETQVNTKTSGQWEVLEFDFTNEATGTQPLSIGLGFGWKFNMASIFFYFGAEGSSIGSSTYYFDHVRFGELTLGNEDVLTDAEIEIFPNPTSTSWQILNKKNSFKLIELFDVNGKLILTKELDSKVVAIDASSYKVGIYFAKLSNSTRNRVVRLIKSF